VPFRLRRDDARFGDLLNDLAAGLPGTARLLAELLGQPPQQMRELLPGLRMADQAAEAGANAVLRALSSAIVTPFDRVDVYRLAWALRTVVQRMAAAGEDVVELEPENLPEAVPELVQLLARAAEVAEDTVRRVPQTHPITEGAVELNRLARQARDAQRQLLVATCAGDGDVGRLVRRLAVSSSFRSVAESFELLAHELQTIAVAES
jgi:uncharacterized protein Yka (UPF0111/DUF47 family)